MSRSTKRRRRPALRAGFGRWWRLLGPVALLWLLLEISRGLVKASGPALREGIQDAEQSPLVAGATATEAPRAPTRRWWRRRPRALVIPPGVAAAVIPAHNEEAVIAATLRSVVGVYHAEDVFVFCDNCNDQTAEIARRFLPDGNVIIGKQQLGKSKGIEYVFRNHVFPSSYLYVTVIDADTTIEPTFLSASLRVLRRKGVAGVVGQVKSRWYPTNLVSVYRTFLYTFWQTVLKRLQSGANCVLIASGCATTWKTRVLKQCEFDPRLSAEDFSLTLQAHRRRLGKVKYVPGAVVWTQDPFSISSYRKQMYRWNRAWWEGVRKHRLGVSLVRFQGVRPVGISILDISACFVLFDTLCFIASLFVLPIMLIHPLGVHTVFTQFSTRQSVLEAIAWQFGTIMALATFVAVVTRKPRIAIYSPLFIPLLYVDLATNLKALFSTVRRLYLVPASKDGRTASMWISPERRKEI